MSPLVLCELDDVRILILDQWHLHPQTTTDVSGIGHYVGLPVNAEGPILRRRLQSISSPDGRRDVGRPFEAHDLSIEERPYEIGKENRAILAIGGAYRE